MAEVLTAENGKKLVMLLKQAASNLRKHASALRESKSQRTIYTVDRQELRRLMNGKK